MNDDESDVPLLSPPLRLASLSPREIVLPKELALEAIDDLARQGVAVVGWEGWRRYPDGGHGHGRKVQGAVPLERRPEQTWESFVSESRDWVTKTIQEEHEAASVEPAEHGELCFCFFIERPRTK